MNKKLLVYFNIYGQSLFLKDQKDRYIKNIKSILKHFNINNLNNHIRFVVSACLVPDYILYSLKREFGDKIFIFSYDARWTVQITSNKTALFAEDYFKEKYFAYNYISSGVSFPEKYDLYPRLIEKMHTKKFGIVAFQSDYDGAYNDAGFGGDYEKYIDFSKDYQIPLGCCAGPHVFCIDEDIKNFYGRPHSDTHGHCGTETSNSYMCAALRKKYILMGDSEIHEMPSAHAWFSDAFNKPYSRLNQLQPLWKNFYDTMLFGRTIDNTILADTEGIDAGLGYYCEINKSQAEQCGSKVVQPNLERYDSELLSLDERLKYAVRRCFFTRPDELDYNKVKVNVI